MPFGRLWYDTPDNAVGYAQFYSRSHDAVIRVYDPAGNMIEHAGGEFMALQARILSRYTRFLTVGIDGSFQLVAPSWG